ncbi:uroporphyrinogen-III synthase [Vibrio metschnikovii]|uniref:uroporphyrinogen-III synthase n=1 Tax=Vibrio metschnikovii TaxID=28172 RepID=UPI002FC70824
MAILVTRPEPQGEALCQLLQQHGHHALHHPLIRIDAGMDLALLRSELSSYEVIVVASQHAVSWVEHTLQAERLSWPTSAIYVAIGQKTAQVLSKASQQLVHYPEISDSEHLLALPALQSVAGKRVVIWRGNGGRELIYQTLHQRGANVDYREMYQRRPLPFDGETALARWQAANVDTLIITSGDQLAFFCSQLPRKAQAWTRALRLLIPSQRIAEQARELGFQHTVITGSAANRDLVAAV